MKKRHIIIHPKHAAGAAPSPRARLRDLGLDAALGRLELPDGLVQALLADDEHLGDHQRVGLVACLLELLARRPPQDGVPGLAARVGPVEVAARAQAVAVERQRLGRRRPAEAAELARGRSRGAGRRAMHPELARRRARCDVCYSTAATWRRAPQESIHASAGGQRRHG